MPLIEFSCWPRASTVSIAFMQNPQPVGMEDTHLRECECLSKLFALLSLALVWAIHIGEWLHEIKPIAIKNHDRRARSIFSYGLDHLRSVILNLEHKNHSFYRLLRFYPVLRFVADKRYCKQSIRSQIYC